MYPQNLHTHGVLCDGKDDYESTVRRALELGFSAIGFSGHSYMPYSPAYGMSKKKTAQYRALVNGLKEKYRGRIDVFCGIEFDMYSDDDLCGYDYVIGSLHYFKRGDRYIGFDRNAEQVQAVIDEEFGGDGMKYAQAYYEELCHLPEYGKMDIVGHFDLITKHSDTHRFFDENSPQYRAWALEAVHTLAETIRVFEVNTGAIARGYRRTPYPAPFILKEIRELGCGVVIGSDCHDNRYLDCRFQESLELIRACGFREVLTLTPRGFTAAPLD
ncbi:MAG: PHP domain-containing protein [Clostridia bacterium]|nr:PHP domain-containing protein [Clostridia bacterium]